MIVRQKKRDWDGKTLHVKLPKHSTNGTVPYTDLLLQFDKFLLELFFETYRDCKEL